MSGWDRFGNYEPAPAPKRSHKGLIVAGCVLVVLGVTVGAVVIFWHYLLIALTMLVAYKILMRKAT